MNVVRNQNNRCVTFVSVNWQRAPTAIVSLTSFNDCCTTKVIIIIMIGMQVFCLEDSSDSVSLTMEVHVLVTEHGASFNQADNDAKCFLKRKRT